MTTSKSSRRRSSKSTQLSRRTRAAYEGGQALLERVQNDPSLQGLREDPEAQPVIEQLHQEVGILAMAPTLRIGAARRLQGASSRRRTASQTLFDACAEVRRRIKMRYRGPRHLELRRAFGEGLPASPAKPETVLTFAQQILEASSRYMEELREVRVGPPTVQRLSTLQGSLRSCAPERVELRTARKQVSENLIQIAARVNGLCNALIAIAARTCPRDDLLTILPAALQPSAKTPRPRARHRT